MPKSATMSPAVDAVDVLHLVRVHAHEPADLVAALGARVHDRGALLDRALVHADVRELAVAAVVELERERDELLVGVRLDHDLGLFVVEIDALVLDLVRRGQIQRHRVEKLLHALVLVRRAHEDRSQLEREHAFAHRGDHLGLGRVALEDRLHQLFREHRDRVEHLLARGVGFGLHLVGNRLLDHVDAHLALEVEGLHPDQVDHALEAIFEADRKLHQHGVVLELLAQLIRHAERVGAGAVELVDEGEPRHVVAPHLAVDRHRLRLHAGDAAEHQDRAVEHAQAALDLDREIHVPGGVDDVDLVATPAAVGGGGLDRDAALALEVHAVHGRADVVLAAHLVDLVDPPGVVEDPLGQRGLARVDVGADADVADERDVVRHGHGLLAPRFRADGLWKRSRSITRNTQGRSGFCRPGPIRWHRAIPVSDAFVGGLTAARLRTGEGPGAPKTSEVFAFREGDLAIGFADLDPPALLAFALSTSSARSALGRGRARRRSR